MSQPIGLSSIGSQVRARVPSSFSSIQLCIAHQVALSVGFSRQEYQSGLPYPPPGDLPDAEIEPKPPVPFALQADSLPLSHPGSLCYTVRPFCT